MSLVGLTKQYEAYETPRWAIEAVLKVELMSRNVLDPCAGTGAIAVVAAEQGYRVAALDIMDWSIAGVKMQYGKIGAMDFLQDFHTDLSDVTVIMNPPFSSACEFVDHARRLNARKIICFQRQAWRESITRRDWWAAHPPARVWVCGERASCVRFDLLECPHTEDIKTCANMLRNKVDKKDRAPRDGDGCRHCMGNSPTAHAWYVWERGHRGVEMTSAIYST